MFGGERRRVADGCRVERQKESCETLANGFAKERQVKGSVLAGFLFGLVFAASASAQQQVKSPKATSVSGGSEFPPEVADRAITDPNPRLHSPGFGLLLPSYYTPVSPGFAYPEPWGTWTKAIQFQCVNLLDQPVSGTMRLTWQRRPLTDGHPEMSFGHRHDWSGPQENVIAPTGKFNGQDSPAEFPANVSNFTLYETPEVSGIIDVKMECDGNGNVQDLVMAVGLRGLFPLQFNRTMSRVWHECRDLDARSVTCLECLLLPLRDDHPELGPEGNCRGDNYPSVGKGDMWHEAVYGVPELHSALKELSRLYRDFTGQELPIGDMSLVYGGTLDLGGNWVAPAPDHSLGIDVDIHIDEGAIYRDSAGLAHSARRVVLNLLPLVQPGLEYRAEYYENPLGQATEEQRLYLHLVLEEWS